jgi:hypothetical protein
MFGVSIRFVLKEHGTFHGYVVDLPDPPLD